MAANARFMSRMQAAEARMQTRNSDPAAWTRLRGAPPLPLAWSGGVLLLALVHHLCLSLWRLPSRVVGAAACRVPRDGSTPTSCPTWRLPLPRCPHACRHQGGNALHAAGAPFAPRPHHEGRALLSVYLRGAPAPGAGPRGLRQQCVGRLAHVRWRVAALPLRPHPAACE